MFNKQKEADVRDLPPRAVEPEIVERTVYVEDRSPRFVLGLILGAVLLAGGVTLFANEEGSYQSAGVAADEAVMQAREQARSVSGGAEQASSTAYVQNP